jgi:hypothetical protein
MLKRRGVYRVRMGKPEGKRPLRRPTHRWENNIKNDLQDVVYRGTEWVHLAEDRVR